jgi:transposase
MNRIIRQVSHKHQTIIKYSLYLFRFKTQAHVCLDELVPQDHFYRQLEATLDLSFVRDLVRHLYLPYGRPSIDPVVFFKLQLIMLFEGIRSERQLMDHVQVNLAFRWYIGYDLDETIPDHSSLTKIRERYGLSIFRRFFEQVVQFCIDNGLVWGQEIYFDGTRVQANASIESNVSNFEYELRNHLNVLFEHDQPSGLKQPVPDVMESWIETYKQPSEWKQVESAYRSLADQRTSYTDPDATPLRRSRTNRSQLGYHAHNVVDGGRRRIILATLVTPASIQDNQPMLDLTRWVRFRWQLHPDVAVGDSKYGSIDNIVGLLQDGIRPLTPRTDYNKGKKFYGTDQFRYDSESDIYICPQGHPLKRQGVYRTNRTTVYRASPTFCDPCPIRAKCTTSKRGRNVHRSFFQDHLDHAEALRQTEAYQKAMRKRKVWVEPKFGEAKQWHGLYRFRLRRLWRVNIEALLIASVQNIKQLLKPRYSRPKPRPPAASFALSLRVFAAFASIFILYLPELSSSNVL